MNYYKLLKLNNWISNPRIKLLVIYIFNLLRKPYLAVYFDPIKACNLRCKMCYFTDKEYVKTLKGTFNPKDLPQLSESLFYNALKLQIGCGTEPTLYKDLDKVFLAAKNAKVPFISLTTNGNLLTQKKIDYWASCGLNEITISLHGVFKETYEEFMGKGNFNLFLNALKYIRNTKETFPNLKLRVNYTFNEDNFLELEHFWKVFNNYPIDVIQIRPIQQIGNTEYSNFSLEKVKKSYEKVYTILKQECNKRKTKFLAPTVNHLEQQESTNSIIRSFTYCYASPSFIWRDDFDWKNESFHQYAKRTKWSEHLIKTIFNSKKSMEKLKNKSLNYDLS